MLSHFSHVQLLGTQWTVPCQASLSMGFSRHEYWSGLPFAPPGDLSDPGIKPTSLMSPALAGRLFTTSAAWAYILLKILFCYGLLQVLNVVLCAINPSCLFYM